MIEEKKENAQEKEEKADYVPQEFSIKRGKLYYAGSDVDSGEAVWTSVPREALSMPWIEAYRLKKLFSKLMPEEKIKYVLAPKFNVVVRLKRYDGFVVYCRNIGNGKIYMCDLIRNAHRFKSLGTAKMFIRDYRTLLEDAGYEEIEAVVLDE